MGTRAAWLWLALCVVARAGTLDVPGQYPTIQAAIDASAAGDLILVQPGTYAEAIVLPGHDLELRGAGPDVTTIDAQGLKTSTVTADASGTWLIDLAGFSITGGHGTPEANGSTNGGGLLASVFDDSQLTLRRCRLIGNVARRGGAAYTIGAVKFEQCEILDNVADNVGGIYAWPGTLIDCVVQGNRALKGSGGGLGGSFTLQDCLIAENEAKFYGGGLWGSAAPQSWLRCRFVANVAEYAGGCSLSGSNYLDFAPVLQNTIFIGNRATVEGGAAILSMYDGPWPIVVRNCVFSGNLTDGAATSLVVEHNRAEQPTRLENCTFLGDQLDADVIVRSSIFWGSPQPILSALDVGWSDVQGGWPGPGNIDADPQLADAAAAGAHLLESSPCRDAGDPTLASSDAKDFDGDPRVQYVRVDMGADEFSGDCDVDGQPDWMEVEAGAADCDGQGIPDECEPFLDCNANGIRDACDIATGVSTDCDADGVPDECQPLADCDGNAVSDWCQSGDCNGNGVPDLCDILAGTSADLDGNGVPDECGGLLLVPTQFPTLQAAVDAAAPGDSIVLLPGVHAGEGNRDVVVSKPLLIAGLTSAAECVLDGEGLGRLISAEAGAPLTLSRLMLRNGVTASLGGGALFVTSGASATVRDCALQDNTAIGWNGGAVLARNGAVLQLERCVLSGNSAALGGALAVNTATATVTHCTFHGNIATQPGLKAIAVRVGSGAQLVLRDSIVRRGVAPAGPVIQVQGGGSALDVAWSDIEGGQAGVSAGAGTSLTWGAGNIDADPLFEDVAAQDFRLSGGSPCIDSADPAGPPDADGTPPDMGALPFEAFTDLGHALPGAAGSATLSGSGTGTAGDPLTLTLAGAPAGASTTLVLGASIALLPFKGGVMVSFPSALLGPFSVPPGGTLVLPGTLPSGLPSGLEIALQSWWPDAGGPQGFAASNGLELEVR